MLLFMNQNAYIRDIAQALHNGKTILYPTDTIWGLGCSALNEVAVNQVFSIKNRPKQKSMILLVSDWEMLARYIHLSKLLSEELQHLLQESTVPTTIIFPYTQHLPKFILAENGSIGVRIPKHHFCHQLIRYLDAPLVSTSANLSGQTSPLQYSDINDDIKKQVDIIVDPAFDTSDYKKPSRILLLSEQGEIEEIR